MLWPKLVRRLSKRAITVSVLSCVVGLGLLACLGRARLVPLIEWMHEYRAVLFVYAVEKDCRSNRFEQAEMEARIAVDEARLCKSDPLVLARSLNWLAYVFIRQRRFDEANPLLVEALSLAERCSKADRPFIASVYRQFAQCYEAKESYEKAILSISKAILAWESEPRVNEKELLIDRLHLSDIQFDAGKYCECLTSCQKILEHPSPNAKKSMLARSALRLGRAFEKLRRNNEAEAAFQNAAALAEQSTKYVRAEYLEELGMYYERAKKKSKARLICQRALQLRDEMLLDNARLTEDGQKPGLVCYRLCSNANPNFLVSLESQSTTSKERQDIDNFMSDVCRGLSTVPGETAETLERTGHQVIVVRSISAACPQLAEIRPVGMDMGLTYDAEDGIYESGCNRVLIARNYYSKREKAMVENSNPAGTVRHEIGHAVDDYLDKFSNSSRFKTIYCDEASKISGKDRKRLAYYLQLGYRGREEAFAELFAIYCGGGHVEERGDILLSHFHKTYQTIEEELTARGLRSGR